MFTVTTTAIDVWNIQLTGSNQRPSQTIEVTSSVRPPTFTITDDPNPKSEQGVTHPPVTRTITPPPFPFSQTVRDPKLPTLGFKSGPPGAPCTSGCGSPCLVFCDKPCLIGCGPGGGSDFPDPIDPNPPKNPNNNENSDSECSTKTASSCGIQCRASPRSCTTTCSKTTGCSVTDTTNSIAITTAGFHFWTDEDWFTTGYGDVAYESSVIADVNADLESDFPGWATDGGASPGPGPRPGPGPTPFPLPPDCRIRCTLPGIGGTGVTCSCCCDPGGCTNLGAGNPSQNGEPCDPKG